MKAFFTLSSLTLLSRIAGFARDMLTARILGAGPLADAFFVALKLPNFFRRITAEGAFTVSFVPLYTDINVSDGTKAAQHFAKGAMGTMISVLLPFTLLCMLAMPLVMWAIAPGFGEGTLRYDMAVLFSRITFPYLMLISVTALLGGVLNAHNRFAPFAAAPILFNLCLIGCLLVAHVAFPSAGHALAWGVLIAGFVQLAFVWVMAKRAGIILLPTWPKLTPNIRRLFKLMLPGLIGAGVVQINLFADIIIASFLPSGALSHLYYADRLNQLPLGTLGIAIGTALLPMLSQAIASNNESDIRSLFNRALEACLIFALPAAFALGLAAQPIILTLFHYGAFTMADAMTTAHILSFYVLGLPAYIAAKVFATACYARQDTKTPVIVAGISVLFNVALALTFVFGLHTGAAGIALATGLAGWVQLGLLWHILRRRRHLHFDTRFMFVWPRVLFATLVMALCVYAAVHFGQACFTQAGLTRWLALGALCVGGGLIYGAIVFASGALRVADLKLYFKKHHQPIEKSAET